MVDCIAKKVIISAPDSNEFLRVSKCVSAKDMWDTLESTHEGSSGTVWQDNDISSSGCRFTLLNNQLKNKNNWLENIVKIMEEELNK